MPDLLSLKTIVVLGLSAVAGAAGWAVSGELSEGSTGRVAEHGPAIRTRSVPSKEPHAISTGERFDLRAFVVRYLEAAPRRGSSGYTMPSSEDERTLARAFALLARGNARAAASLARPLAYEVLRTRDRATGRRLVILAERATSTADRRGWGLYVHAVGGTSPVTVEIPHPLSDRHTELLGVALFRRAAAANLFIAGSERDADADGSSDVAHAPASVFREIGRAVARPGTTVVQVHGFARSNHSGYGDAVVSAGTSPATPSASAVGAALQNKGFATCVYDGSSCTALGATTNVEGADVRSRGGSFVHVELSAEIRSDPNRWRRAIAAVASALSRARAEA